MTPITPPFPWFGGKRRIAEMVWDRFGTVDAFVEPFIGAGAVFLARPNPVGMETINDLDGLVANFWRAVQGASAAVALEFRSLLSEIDLQARHRAVHAEAENLTRALIEDTRFYDPRLAAWWAWGVCLSIGDNFMQPQQKDQPIHLSTNQGCIRIHLGRWSGVITRDRDDSLLEYLRALQDRLRGVRVLCGDWARAVGSTATTFHGSSGVFLDPPYSAADRADCYRMEDRTLSARVQAWCLDHGADPRFRIAVCGYDGEYDLPGWEMVAWKANGGQGSTGGRGQANRHRERVWFSPHCIRVLPLVFDDTDKHQITTGGSACPA